MRGALRGYGRLWVGTVRARGSNRSRLEGGHAGAGEGVGALVLGVAGVALDPVPGDAVAGGGGIETAPEILVLHRLVLGRAPAVELPAVNPAGDAVAQVGAVGD